MPNGKLVPVKTRHPLKKDRYYIDKSGKVFWKTVGGEFRRMKHFVTKDGYHEYVLALDTGKKVHVQGQHLSVATFKGYPKDARKNQVNHKNGIRHDNRPSNLVWVTPSQNIKHSFAELGKKVWNSNKE